MAKSHVGVPVGEPVEEYLVKPVFDADGVQVSSGIGKDGKEYPDPVPMEPPIGYNAPPDLMTMIKTMVHAEHFRRAVDEAGGETFEEADDFEIDDDPLDPNTIYEKYFEAKAEADALKEEKRVKARNDVIAEAVAKEKASLEARPKAEEPPPPKAGGPMPAAIDAKASTST